MKIAIPLDAITVGTFCRKWKIREFSLFGSVLRDDFRPDSDVDVLVDFEEDAGWTIFDCMEMEEDLERILGKKVDVFTRKSVQRSNNWIRRDQVLQDVQTIYVQR